MTDGLVDRRRFLAGLAATMGAGTLAGCAGAGGDGDDTDAGDETDTPGDGADPTTDADTAATATASTRANTTAANGPTATAGEEALDRREANVVGVAVEGTGDGVRFDVTLLHDDDGEEGYANWWQVETRGGERLGRRELLHPHSEQPFTRSATVAVPDGAACVVVRGHDETHGYGGRAMLVAVGTGRTRAVDQGPDPRDLRDAACP